MTTIVTYLLDYTSNSNVFCFGNSRISDRFHNRNKCELFAFMMPPNPLYNTH